jgi:hypothetical protein
MKRDTKVLIAGLIVLALGIFAIRLTETLQVLPDGHTIDNSRYHWLAISALLLLFLGSVSVCGATVAFCGRLTPKSLLIGGLAFLIPASLYSLAGREIAVQSYNWVVLLVPWIVAVFSGGMMLLIGTVKLIVAKIRA